MRLIATTFMVLASGFAMAEHAGPHYVCAHHDKVREIEVVYDVAGEVVPCAVHYRKRSDAQILWTAQAEAGYCEQKAESFVAKQQEWGWACESKKHELAVNDANALQRDDMHSDMRNDVKGTIN